MLEPNQEVELEILRASHNEYMKALKDMAMYYPLNHPKRVRYTEESNRIVERIQLIVNLKDSK